MKQRLILGAIAAILLLTGFAIGKNAAADFGDESAIIGLNHVGLRVADFDRALEFYQDKLGFPLAYRIDNEQGKPVFAYFQINRSTFIELLPATEERPEGIDHFGLETHGMDALVPHMRDLGIESSDPYISPYTGVKLAHASDASGNYFELIEAMEGSRLHSAIESWKD